MCKRKASLKCRQRIKLYKLNPYCCYCGVETKFFEKLSPQNIPNDAATLEHIYSRLDPIRKSPEYVTIPFTSRVKICCFKCNQEKGSKDQQKFYIIQKFRSIHGCVEKTKRKSLDWFNKNKKSLFQDIDYFDRF